MPISIHLRTTPPSPPTVSASVPRPATTTQCRAFERHPRDTWRAERRLGDGVPEGFREQRSTFSGPRDAAAQRRRERSPPAQRSICAANSAPRPHHTAKAQRQARAYASRLCQGGIPARTGVPPGPRPACKGPRQGPRRMPQRDATSGIRLPRDSTQRHPRGAGAARYIRHTKSRHVVPRGAGAHAPAAWPRPRRPPPT